MGTIVGTLTETRAGKPRTLMTDSYPQVTNGDEKQSERLQGTFATKASLSRWFASQEDHHGNEPDSHPGVPLPSEIRADGHRGRRLSRALGHHRQHQRLNHLLSRALGLGTRVSADLQQAYGKRGQQTQQADQTVNGLQLPFFNATPTLKALMIVLHQPAIALPVHA